MSSFSIGQVASQSGVSVETIRFYERTGLIDEPERKESGYRMYRVGDVKKLVFIQHAKQLGFSLKEIKDLLSLKSDPRGSTRAIKQMAQNKLDDIEAKISMLNRMKHTLKPLVDKCPGTGPASDCPILEALES